MKAAAFEFAAARSAVEAVELLGSAPGESKLLAGGQSLGPMLNLRLVQPALLVDLRHCADLRFVQDEGESLVFGAGLTHADFEDGAVPDVTGGLLAHAASRIAYRAVRNRGTLGGSLSHADPAADWPAVMLALGAEVIIRGPEGLRALSLGDFLVGPFETGLRHEDLLVGVRLSKGLLDWRLGYHKLTLKEGEFAESFAVSAWNEAGRQGRLVISALERRPLVIEGDEAAAALSGAVSRDILEELIAAKLPMLSRVARRTHAVVALRAISHDWRGGSR